MLFEFINLISDKIKSSNNIFLVESDEIINENDGDASVLNKFFVNAIAILKMSEYSGTDSWASSISHTVLKAIFKYRKHPTIDTINKITTWDENY